MLANSPEKAGESTRRTGGLEFSLRRFVSCGLIVAMHLARQFRIWWLGFLLPLILLCSNGCSTDQSGITANKDLEKYHKVYLIRPRRDDRDLTTSILSRLKRAGFDASETDEEGAKKLAAARDAKEPTLICQFHTLSTWDYNRSWYCFENAQIHFFDLESGAMVFRVDYFHPNSFLPENTELNRLFIQIRDNFFPGQPNPFRDNLKGPYGPANLKFQIDN